MQFWVDRWFRLGVVLGEHALAPIPTDIIHASVASFLDQNGQWDVGKFSAYQSG